MFTRDMGIDLGTANTLVYMRRKGIIMREPSVVAKDVKNNTVKFVGREAKEVIGRTPGSIVAVSPLKDGVILIFSIASLLTLSSQTVCQIPLTLVYHIPPLLWVCLPYGKSLSSGSVAFTVSVFAPSTK